jgi:hypothetical protein
MIAAGIANYLMNTLGIDIPDDGNLSNLIGWMTTAFTSAPPSLSMSENLAGSSRFFGTAYTASTAPLIVTISGYATSEGTLVVSVGGLSIPAIQTSAAGERGDATITFAVPKGTAYSAVGSNGTGATLNLSTWIETQLL